MRLNCGFSPGGWVPSLQRGSLGRRDCLLRERLTWIAFQTTLNQSVHHPAPPIICLIAKANIQLPHRNRNHTKTASAQCHSCKNACLQFPLLEQNASEWRRHRQKGNKNSNSVKPINNRLMWWDEMFRHFTRGKKRKNREKRRKTRCVRWWCCPRRPRRPLNYQFYSFNGL